MKRSVEMTNDKFRMTEEARISNDEEIAPSECLELRISDFFRASAFGFRMLFPKFSLTGAAGLQSISASDWFTGNSKFWSAGPTVQWRVLDAGRIRANIRVQTAKQEETLAVYEKAVLTSLQDVENALVAYAKEQVRNRSLKDEADANRRGVELANELYTKGLADFLNVLDAQRSLYQAEDQLVQSEKTIAQNLVALYKALGGGWETERRLAQDKPGTQ